MTNKVNKKQKAILVDIHQTLLLKDGQVNSQILQLIQTLAKEYYLLGITASYYASDDKFKHELGSLTKLFDGLYYNSQEKESLTNKKFKKSNENDRKIKLHLYKNQIMPIFDVIAIIDNNKHVCKGFIKVGVDAFRYKHGK